MSLRGPTFDRSRGDASDLTVGPSGSSSLVTGCLGELPRRMDPRSPSDPAFPSRGGRRRVLYLHRGQRKPFSQGFRAIFTRPHVVPRKPFSVHRSGPVLHKERARPVHNSAWGGG